MRLPTKLVMLIEEEGDRAFLINESDFDPEIHEEVSASDPDPDDDSDLEQVPQDPDPDDDSED